MDHSVLIGVEYHPRNHCKENSFPPFLKFSCPLRVPHATAELVYLLIRCTDPE